MKKLMMLLVVFGLVMGVSSAMAGEKGPDGGDGIVARCKGFMDANPEQTVFKNLGECVSPNRGGNDLQELCAGHRADNPDRYVNFFGSPGLGACMKYFGD